MSTPGPTVPRWRLGRQLTQLREAAGVTQEEVARLLGCSLKTARRMEHGEVSVARGDLLVLLERYNVGDEAKRAELLDLQKRGRQRAWWSSLGPFYENNTGAFLEFESAATVIRTYESMAVPGLLQVRDYVEAVTGSMSPTMATEDIESAVELRLIRQEKLFKPDPPSMFFVLDEAVLRRPVGGAEAHRRQLEHLRSVASARVSFQVVPFEAGVYAGMPGPFTIFEFGSGVRDPVLYVEGRAGNLYVENHDEVRTCLEVFDQLRSVALSPSETLHLLDSILSDR
jgi:transcriptional regulator with XRE-family HTH domain